MPKPFLVAVDFSDLTKATVERAAGLALGRGHRVDLLTVVTPPRMPTRGAAARSIYEQALEQKQRAARERIDVLSKTLPEEVRGQRLVRSGIPSEVIVDTAREDYDMVILSTHGRTGLSHTFLGSVAESVVRHAPISVLVVR